MTGAITQHIDVAQVVLYVFWIFFAGLIIYLRREDRREGFPMIPDGRRDPGMRADFFPNMPAAKTFRLAEGHVIKAPGGAPDLRPVAAAPAAGFPGAPLVPTGNPMADGVGPAAWAQRRDEPDLTSDGRPRIRPLALEPHHHVAEDDRSPIGFPVIAADGKSAGAVAELWIDLSEPAIRYYEIELADGGGRVLFPSPLANVDQRRGRITTGCCLAAQFAGAPRPAGREQVTKLEEDKICGYFAGGYLYATPDRAEPLV